MSPHHIQRQKRKLSEELESTAESLPMFASKRPRVENKMRPRCLEFNPETIAKILYELVRARRYWSPYDNKELTWENDMLWSLIIENLQLREVNVQVDDLKLTVLHYYQIYQLDDGMPGLNLPESYMGKRTVTYATEIFKPRRNGVGEYLDSCFKTPGSCFKTPPALAIELYRESTSAETSHKSGLSGIQPLRSYPSKYDSFVECLNEVHAALSAEEKSWAEYEMTRYSGQMAVFCAKTPAERITYVKTGYAREQTYSSMWKSTRNAMTWGRLDRCLLVLLLLIICSLNFQFVLLSELSICICRIQI